MHVGISIYNMCMGLSENGPNKVWFIHISPINLWFKGCAPSQAHQGHEFTLCCAHVMILVFTRFWRVISGQAIPRGWWMWHFEDSNVIFTWLISAFSDSWVMFNLQPSQGLSSQTVAYLCENVRTPTATRRATQSATWSATQRICASQHRLVPWQSRTNPSSFNISFTPFLLPKEV
jgi:hypothetical protein